MSWLDLFILATAVSLAVAGLLKGAVKLILPMVGLTFGVVAAIRFYQPLASRLLSSDSGLARLVAFAIILAAILVVTGLVANIATKTLSVLMLGWLNRLAGLAAGAALGTLLSLVLILLASHYIDLEPAVKGSALVSRLLDNLPFILRLVPEDFRRVADFLVD